MHKIKIKRVTLQNFKCFKTKEICIGNTTRISAMNGVGKSSLATAIMWTLFGVDYDLTNNPKVRREVDGEPVNDVPVTVEIVMVYDGKEVTVQKTQKRSINKDGSYADSNFYSVNGVNKTLRDFNAYFDFSFDDLLMCMNPAAFLAQKPVEMRKFLFKLPQDVSDKDIVARFPELSGLAKLVEKYTVNEISAMNKASITRLTKEIAEYPGRIDEVHRQIVEDVDVAELELQINALNEQIADVERQENDALSQSSEMESMQRNLMELRGKKAEIENKAYEAIREERANAQKKLDRDERMIFDYQQALTRCELAKKRIKAEIARRKEEKDNLLADYEKVAAETYPEYVPLPELDENAFVCPTCGQDFPEEKREQIIAEYEEKKQKHKVDYQDKLASFEQNKSNRLAYITERGRRLRDSILDLETGELHDLEDKIQEVQSEIELAKTRRNEWQARLNKIPAQPDLSVNQEYEALSLEISAKEEALRSMNTGSDRKTELRCRKSEIQYELDSSKERLAKVNNNVVLENRLEELRREQIQKSQAKADCERILDLLAELDKKKNEYLVKDINSHFGGRVTWDLFAYAKNGNYKADYCVPRIDGYTLNDNTANHGRVLEAMMIIAQSIQKIVGINAPVLLDNAEALDYGNLKRILSGANCQMIVFAVSDSDKLGVKSIIK